MAAKRENKRGARNPRGELTKAQLIEKYIGTGLIVQRFILELAVFGGLIACFWLLSDSRLPAIIVDNRPYILIGIAVLALIYFLRKYLPMLSGKYDECPNCAKAFAQAEAAAERSRRLELEMRSIRRQREATESVEGAKAKQSEKRGKEQRRAEKLARRNETLSELETEIARLNGQLTAAEHSLNTERREHAHAEEELESVKGHLSLAEAKILLLENQHKEALALEHERHSAAEHSLDLEHRGRLIAEEGLASIRGELVLAHAKIEQLEQQTSAALALEHQNVERSAHESAELRTKVANLEVQFCESEERGDKLSALLVVRDNQISQLRWGLEESRRVLLDERTHWNRAFMAIQYGIQAEGYDFVRMQRYSTTDPTPPPARRIRRSPRRRRY